MDKELLKKLLEDVKSGNLEIDGAMDKLKNLPYEDLGFAKIDTPLAAFSMMSLLCGQTRVGTFIGQRKGEMS